MIIDNLHFGTSTFGLQNHLTCLVLNFRQRLQGHVIPEEDRTKSISELVAIERIDDFLLNFLHDECRKILKNVFGIRIQQYIDAGYDSLG